MNRSQFNPPPRVMNQADLDSVARRHGTGCRKLKETALHESAHALAAIIYKRSSVMVILRPDGVGKIWYYPRSISNHGELYEEAVISWCGLTAEQAIQDDAGDVVDNAAKSDHFNATNEAAEYAAECLELPPPWLRVWCKSRSPKQRVALAKRVEQLAIQSSLRDSRTLVCNYWPLIEEMAYVSLRDCKDGLHWWTDLQLDWVHQRIAEIDSGKQARKTAYPRPAWLRKVGGVRKNRDLLATSRGLVASIGDIKANDVLPASNLLRDGIAALEASMPKASECDFLAGFYFGD